MIIYYIIIVVFERGRGMRDELVVEDDGGARGLAVEGLYNIILYYIISYYIISYHAVVYNCRNILNHIIIFGRGRGTSLGTKMAESPAVSLPGKQSYINYIILYYIILYYIVLYTGERKRRWRSSPRCGRRGREEARQAGGGECGEKRSGARGAAAGWR